MVHNNKPDTDWEVIKTADVEIDGGEITDATLYVKDGIYMMVVRGESNYGPDEDYAEWDTDNYKEAITKFREFVTEHRKRNKKSQQLRAARDERTATCKLIIRTDYNSMSVKQIYDYIVDDINKLEPDINYKITLKPGAGMWKGLAYDLTIQSDEKDINRIKQLIGVCAIVSDLKFWKLNASRKGVNMRNRKLNSAVDSQGNVTLTIPYYIWRLIYTCVYGYSERSSDIIYGDGKFDGYLNSIIHKIESALHGTWETLNVNQDPEGEKMDFYLDTNTLPGFEERELTDADTQAISITFTVQEGQVIYRCLEVMEDQYADSYIFSDEDLDDCYNIQKYIEGQLQMTGRQIIDATAFNASRKGVNMRNRKLNSSVADSYMDVYDEVADVVREVVFDHIVDILDECNIANINSRVPEYNGDWCATDWTTDDDDKKFEISDALVDFVLDGLFRHAGTELEVKFKEK